MATIKEIEDKRDEALKILRAQRRRADKLDMQQLVTDLTDKINAVHNEAVIAVGTSEELERALKLLTEATKALVDKAAEMKTAAEFIAKAAELIGKAEGVLTAIKDGAKKLGAG